MKPTCKIPSLYYKLAVVFIVFIVILTGTASGQNDYSKFRRDIADPGQIPKFDDFRSPTIHPGETGSLEFTIENRYAINKTNTNNITSNVSLTINIYRYVVLEKSENISKISNGPKIKSGGAGFSSTPNKNTAKFYWDSIGENEIIPVSLKIRSSTQTPQGTYMIRMHLNFSFNGTFFDMKSYGYFTKDQWLSAEVNATDQGDSIVGRLDLNALGVDGIIPDTSIRIKEPIPIWPLYTMGGLAILFGVLAVVFYYIDDRGKLPGVKRKLDNFGEKINNYRYRRD